MQMMMRVFVGMALLFVVACAPKPEAQPVTAEPVSTLVFEPDHVDMGTVKEGDDAVVWLRVRNSGDTLQQIVDLTTSCGCSVAEPEERLLMPGGFTRVKVTIDTFAKQDDVRKWVVLTDGDGLKSKAWLTLAVRPNPHMAATSRSIFDGQCGSCHFDTAAGKKTGPAIYAAVCGMCHGAKGEGGPAPALNAIGDRDILMQLVANGTGSQHMPGFAKAVGGPLNDAQLNALVHWLSKLDASGASR